MEFTFILNQVFKFIILALIMLACGHLVQQKNIKVNYTRKIVHFSIFLVPISLNHIFAYEHTLQTLGVSSVVVVAALFVFVQPLRERNSLISLMFKAFDRPEDRPNTLLWLITQALAGYMVIVPMIILYRLYDLQHLIFIPLLITALGDGLAEPVGVRFGRHRYQVYALFSQKKYIRTLEGSACVFGASLLVIAMYHGHFSLIQFLTAILVLPPVMALIEAFSPHTWDTPTLFLAGYAVLFWIAGL